MSIIPKKNKQNYKVLKLGELEYCRNKINSILCLCLSVDIPKKKKNKQNYKVLKLGELEYCRNKINIILFFLIAQFPSQQCHSGKTYKNSSVFNSSFKKSGISLISSEIVLFCYKFLKIVVFGHFHPFKIIEIVKSFFFFLEEDCHII